MTNQPRPDPRANYQNPDGSLHIVNWADPLTSNGKTERTRQVLAVSLGPRPTRMAHSTATGRGLLSNGLMGVDLIRLGAGESFVPHTHPGDHLLIVVGGEGTITVNGTIYPTVAGQVYMVEGRVPHAVGAITAHVILAVGSPHKAVDDESRMTPVEYQDVLAEYADGMRCLICEVSSPASAPIHEAGCKHCPCPMCTTTGDPQEDHRRRRSMVKDAYGGYK